MAFLKPFSMFYKEQSEPLSVTRPNISIMHEHVFSCVNSNSDVCGVFSYCVMKLYNIGFQACLLEILCITDHPESPLIAAESCAL